MPGTGLPRILDVGQCNDAYSAIRIALALAEAFGCSVNELPLSLVLCWFEQKAVCILAALLALGLRGIRLGPTLPAFLSPGFVKLLQDTWAAAGRDGAPQIRALDYKPDAEKLAHWRDLGVTEVVFGMPDKSESEIAGYVERLAGKLSQLV